MPFITNSVFNDVEKAHLEFVLSKYFPERSAVIDQLNNMNDTEITRDITPYYWIMEFRPNGINAGHGPMRPYIDVEACMEQELRQLNLPCMREMVLYLN